MSSTQKLSPARNLAAMNDAHHPNESEEYRQARTALLAEEIELERGWRNLKLYSGSSGQFTRDYVSAQDADMPGYNVFRRKAGTIRHFWSNEGGPETADPGQDPHDAPDMSPLWTILDTTPDGHGSDWYPKLEYR